MYKDTMNNINTLYLSELVSIDMDATGTISNNIESNVQHMPETLLWWRNFKCWVCASFGRAQQPYICFLQSARYTLFLMQLLCTGPNLCANCRAFRGNIAHDSLWITGRVLLLSIDLFSTQLNRFLINCTVMQIAKYVGLQSTSICMFTKQIH